MIFPKHWTEGVRALHAALYCFLVKIITKDINAIRRRQIVENISVKISSRHARRGLEEPAKSEVFAHETAELKRDAFEISELQVGDVRPDLISDLVGLGEFALVNLGEAHEACVAALGHLRRRIVRTKKPLWAIFVEGDLRRQQSCNPRLISYRSRHGLEQQQPRP